MFYLLTSTTAGINLHNWHNINMYSTFAALHTNNGKNGI
jgi:hypothetical protein